MLLNSPYPSDVRVKKEAQALVNSGHKVFLICLRRKGEDSYAVADGMYITRIHGGKTNIALAFWDIIMSLRFIHPVFQHHLSSWITKNGIEVLHVHDLPLAGTALWAKKNLGIPVVLDLHENYPDALGIWFSWKRNPLVRIKNRLFMHPEKWKKHEKTAVEGSNKIIAVVEEMRDRLVHDYQTDQDKIVVVTNTEGKSFVSQPLFPDVYAQHKGNLILAYTGNIGPHRGVDTVIEAMALLKEKPIHFIISGHGNMAVMKHLSKMVDRLMLRNQVFFYGHQPFDRFYSLMHFADVNVIPHKSNPHTDHTVPHKLFQAMMAGKPLLVSSCRPLKRIVEGTRSGLVFRHDDPADCALAIQKLYENPELRQSLGAMGMEITLNGNLNWEHTQLQLLQLYNTLTS